MISRSKPQEMIRAGRVVPPPQLDVMSDVPTVPAYDGNDDRPGCNGGAGSAPAGTRRLVYSVNTIHMGLDSPQITPASRDARDRGPS